MKILTFLFFLFAGIWFVGLILRTTFSRWLHRRTEEYNRAAKAARKEAQRRARGNREGEVTIETTEAAFAKKVSRGVGEYVEFEEVTEISVEEREKTSAKR